MSIRLFRQVDQPLLRGPYTTEVDREGLETVVLGLEFRIRAKHFKRGDMKIKCLATIATIYWKTNELSIESYRTENKAPVMESRETRPQGHTHAEHILGKLTLYIYYYIYMHIRIELVCRSYILCTRAPASKQTESYMLLWDERGLLFSWEECIYAPGT